MKSLLCTILFFLYLVVMAVDAFVEDTDTHMELCRALKTSREDNCMLKLRIHKLELSCLGVPRITVLLELIDERVLIFMFSTRIIFCLFAHDHASKKEEISFGCKLN